MWLHTIHMKIVFKGLVLIFNNITQYTILKTCKTCKKTKKVFKKNSSVQSSFMASRVLITCCMVGRFSGVLLTHSCTS